MARRKKKATVSKTTVQASWFLQLPGEIRNRVYELTMATKADSGEEIDLLTGDLPPKPLLSVCRQTRHEARSIYEYARHRFITVGKFVIEDVGTVKPARVRKALARLDTASINHLRIKTLRAPSPGGVRTNLNIHWEEGVWSTTVSGLPHNFYVVYQSARVSGGDVESSWGSAYASGHFMLHDAKMRVAACMKAGVHMSLKDQISAHLFRKGM